MARFCLTRFCVTRFSVARLVLLQVCTAGFAWLKLYG